MKRGLMPAEPASAAQEAMLNKFRVMIQEVVGPGFEEVQSQIKNLEGSAARTEKALANNAEEFRSEFKEVRSQIKTLSELIQNKL
jgi:predicted  nucleic acid-binding Zn-ribbon protein